MQGKTGNADIDRIRIEMRLVRGGNVDAKRAGRCLCRARDPVELG
jgi:hypothetical protein